jgi:hypothetical protein
MRPQLNVPRRTRTILHLVNRPWLLIILISHLILILIPVAISGPTGFSGYLSLQQRAILPGVVVAMVDLLQFAASCMATLTAFLLPFMLVVMALILVSPAVDPIPSLRRWQLGIILGTLGAIALTWPMVDAFFAWLD